MLELYFREEDCREANINTNSQQGNKDIVCAEEGPKIAIIILMILWIQYVIFLVAHFQKPAGSSVDRTQSYQQDIYSS